MKYDRIPDDEQKQTPLNFFPSSSPFLPQTRHYFYQEKFASQPPPAKKRYTTLKKKKERRGLINRSSVSSAIMYLAETR